MFDVGWSELLVVGIVALVVVGPKELPVLLRTVGKYVGMIRRQAGEFRAQFDEAMREAELDQLKKDVTALKNDAESTFRDTERAVSSEFDAAHNALNTASSQASPALGTGAAAAAAAASTPEPTVVPAVTAASLPDAGHAASGGQPAAEPAIKSGA